MNGNGITAERIYDHDIELMIPGFFQFPLERNSSISHNDLNIPFGIFNIGKLLIGQFKDRRIDFVKPVNIARSAVAAQSTGAQTDDSDFDGMLWSLITLLKLRVFFGMLAQGDAHPLQRAK